MIVYPGEAENNEPELLEDLNKRSESLMFGLHLSSQVRVCFFAFPLSDLNSSYPMFRK